MAVSPTGQAANQPVGRPRDPEIDDRVLTAVRQLLTESGWAATTIRGVAARAQVSRSTVLRRWPSKAHLVLEAVLGTAPDLQPFEGVDRRGWIRWVSTASAELFARTEMRAAVPGLLAALHEQPELRQSIWQTFTTQPVAMFADAHPGLGDDTRLDATAIIVIAAGAALFANVLADQEDLDALRHRIEEVLLASEENRRTVRSVEDGS